MAFSKTSMKSVLNKISFNTRIFPSKHHNKIHSQKPALLTFRILYSRSNQETTQFLNILTLKKERSLYKLIVT